MNDASTPLDKNVPLGEFLDEELARAKEIENTETGEIIETENYETPLDLAHLGMNFLRYLRVMLWVER